MAIQLSQARLGQIALRHMIDKTLKHALQNGCRRPTEKELEKEAPELGQQLVISTEEALAYLKQIHRY